MPFFPESLTSDEETRPMQIDSVIYWLRSIGPDGKDRVPMYFKGKLPRSGDEGRRGDIRARPISLGLGEYTGVFAPDDFEAEDGSKVFA